MKRGFAALFGVLLLLTAGCASPERFYVGGAEGIYRVASDSCKEQVTHEGSVAALAVSGRNLYAARTAGKGAFEVVLYAVKEDGALERKGAFPIPGRFGYCHLALSADGKFLYGSSYSGAFIDVIGLKQDGSFEKLRNRLVCEGASVHKRQKKSHPHFCAPLPGTELALAADLGSDLIRIFRRDDEKGLLPAGTVPVPPGSGPRHLCFVPEKQLVFAVNELNNTVCSFKVRQDTLAPVAVCGLLPQGWSGVSYAGAIKLSPGGKIFATNRGHDSIAVVSFDADGAMRLEACFGAGGAYPSDLVFDKAGRMLLVNMKGNELSVWKVQGNAYSRTAGLPVRRPGCIVSAP